MLGSLAAIAVVVIGGSFALRSITIDEARRDSRERVEAEGHLVEVSPTVSRAAIAPALTRLDDMLPGADDPAGHMRHSGTDKLKARATRRAHRRARHGRGADDRAGRVSRSHGARNGPNHS